MDTYYDTNTAKANNRRNHSERVQVEMYSEASLNAGIVTIIEVTRGDTIKQFWEASPAAQKNLPSGKVSGWPTNHLWLKVDASRFPSHANWTSTEDSFPDLCDVEHCVAGSNEKYSIPSTSCTQFLPN